MSWVNELSRVWESRARESSGAARRLPYNAQSLKGIHNTEAATYQKAARELRDLAEEQSLAVVLELEALLEQAKIPMEMTPEGAVTRHFFGSIRWEQLNEILEKYRPKKEVRVET